MHFNKGDITLKEEKLGLEAWKNIIIFMHKAQLYMQRRQIYSISLVLNFLWGENLWDKNGKKKVKNTGIGHL